MKAIALFGSLAVLFVIASNMNFNDQLEQQQHYNQMVCDGLWPDYNNLKPDCK